MKEIVRCLALPADRKKAFDLFVYDLGAWWPGEYTWSKEKLEEIRIDAVKDGLCTETGPYGFICDWGRVTDLEPGYVICIKWQVSFQRVPIPDPDKSSDIAVVFRGLDEGRCELHFRHFNFDKHGPEAEIYHAAMDCPEGWDYILKKYMDHVAATAGRPEAITPVFL